MNPCRLQCESLSVTAVLVRALLCCGVAASQLAIISPYKAQLKAIRAQLPPGTNELPVLTTDKSKGQVTYLDTTCTNAILPVLPVVYVVWARADHRQESEQGAAHIGEAHLCSLLSVLPAMEHTVVYSVVYSALKLCVRHVAGL